MREYTHCLHCGAELKGRIDKKFCNNTCKNAFQYQKIQEETPDFYFKVEKQLKRNRRILKKFNRAGKATVRSEILYEEGFDPNFFTHYWKNQNGDVYLFVYEYGFIRRTENGKSKYVLVKWQEYMSKYRY